MARLNEPPMSTDNIETLRRKMLRQNRELAKCNNVRALRIRELESELACAISENLTLRGRILELEGQAEDKQARRVADHALDIKQRLESQLAEWSTIVAELGVQPPKKRRLPESPRSQNQRSSASLVSRTSPSQRRLRDIAREVEELGHISEHKAFSRQSLNPEQISALISEADSAAHDRPLHSVTESPTRDPVKIDSPDRPVPQRSSSSLLNSPVRFPSPVNESTIIINTSPKKRSTLMVQPDEVLATVEERRPKPVKAGSKRKLDFGGEMENVPVQRIAEDGTDTNSASEKVAIREKAYGKSLKELASIRREARNRPDTTKPARKPLSSKTTNEDITSPKKLAHLIAMDDIAVAKANLVRQKPAVDKLKPKSKVSRVESLSLQESVTPKLTASPVDFSVSMAETAFLSPASPEPTPPVEEHRGDTPPPADISSMGETSRPSRRNRTTISYAEPSLRVKMRRPTKELFDAVAGEAKSRRWSQSLESTVKRESAGPDALQAIPAADNSPMEQVETTEKRKRTSSVRRALDFAAHLDNDDDEDAAEVDVYDFESSSPKMDESTGRPTRGKASRRFSAAVDAESASVAKERTGSRRRSMMV
ncbi:Putative Shugoshin family protein [[Torrubiella] hemipterigena]|uniref:Putative Shugoshin family protein n=1 Tax=[Torrubiella] hemipterigena TaxID=1531966 RepID=A0A0A1T8K1_9HYPO|nr:Putative Shugoshin family protein [[Torrubiella] hemipterigena]